MTTLADELLNDFEDSGSEVDDHDQNGPPDDEPRAGRAGSTPGMELDRDQKEVAEDEEDAVAAQHDAKDPKDAPDEEETKARVAKMKLGTISDVRSVAGLMTTLQPVLEKIAHYQSIPPDERTSTTGLIEDNPEYKLLTQSNSLATSIDAEIILVHKFIRDHYSTRFPELETLITNPLDYAKTVAILKNGPLDNIRTLANSTDNLVGASLKSILDGPSLMVVTVEATTTKGREMTESELQTTLRACRMTLELDHAKKILTDYVQSRMTLFAPNLTALIGSLTAAQLINFAGGVTGLAKTPACNIPPLGSKKQTQTGFATNVGIRQQGFLYHSPIIQGIPNDRKRQAMRIVSAKLVLAARVDCVHHSPDGSIGAELRQACLDRLDKLTEPPPNKGPRALPAPDDKPSRKRGGRRARKAKEATAMTDLRKQQNRLAFGKEEKEVGYGTGEGTKGLGMLGQENDGRIRAGQIDQRTRAKLSKKNPGWGGTTTSTTVSSGSGMASSLKGFGFGAGAGVGVGGNASVLRAQGLRTSGVSGGVSGVAGTASSIAFTPVQGLELVDPKVRAELNRKRKAEEDRWFSGGTFTQVANQRAEGVGGGDGAGAGAGAGAGGGFKIPQLPASKKLNTGT